MLHDCVAEDSFGLLVLDVSTYRSGKLLVLAGVWAQVSWLGCRRIENRYIATQADD